MNQYSMKSIVIILTLAIFFRFENIRSQANHLLLKQNSVKKKTISTPKKQFTPKVNLEIYNIPEITTRLPYTMNKHVEFFPAQKYEKFTNLMIKIFNLNSNSVPYKIVFLNSDNEICKDRSYTIDPMKGIVIPFNAGVLQCAKYVIIEYNNKYANQPLKIQSEYIYKNLQSIINNIPEALILTYPDM